MLTFKLGPSQLPPSYPPVPLFAWTKAEKLKAPVPRASSELRAAHLPRARRWAPAHRWCRHRLADGLHTTQWPPWGRRRSWDRRRGPTQSKGSRRGKQVVLSHVSRTRSVVKLVQDSNTQLETGAVQQCLISQRKALLVLESGSSACQQPQDTVVLLFGRRFGQEIRLHASRPRYCELHH